MQATNENKRTIIKVSRYISLVSTKRTLQISESDYTDQELPHGTSQLLQQELIAKSVLRRGVNIRQKAYDRIDGLCIKTVKGDIVSPTNVDKLVTYLEEYQDEWCEWVKGVEGIYANKRELLLDSLENDPILATKPYRKDFLEAAHKKCPTTDELVSVLNFDFDIDRIDVEFKKGRKGAQNAIMSAVESIQNEIATKGFEIYSNVEKNKKGGATDSQVEAALNLSRKVDSFSYLSPKLAKVGEGLILFFLSVKTGATLSGTKFSVFREALSYLANLENVKAAYENETPIVPMFITGQLSKAQPELTEEPADNSVNPNVLITETEKPAKLEKPLKQKPISIFEAPSDDDDLEDIISALEEDTSEPEATKAVSNKDLGNETLTRLQAELNEELENVGESEQLLPVLEEYEEDFSEFDFNQESPWG